MIGDFLITHQFMIAEPATTDTGMDACLEQKHGQDSIQHTDVLPYLKSNLSIFFKKSYSFKILKIRISEEASRAP